MRFISVVYVSSILWGASVESLPVINVSTPCPEAGSDTFTELNLPVAQVKSDLVKSIGLGQGEIPDLRGPNPSGCLIA
ncbi:hypothetical protein DFH06DRAFT_1213843 [Mycena polygramma]|nr:hypothetical protein DFH06DRAFT_1213843 [Mycena polygramma]